MIFNIETKERMHLDANYYFIFCCHQKTNMKAVQIKPVATIKKPTIQWTQAL
jgi:hypothetical protein